MRKPETTFCRICEPFCSLIAEFGDDGKIRHISPDTAHPTGGLACHKGLSFLDVHNDPDRLNWPLRRTNPRSEAQGEFVEVDWDTALGEIGQSLKTIREKFGPNAVAIYAGNPFFLSNAADALAIDPFRQALGTQMMFGSNTQDASNKVRGAEAIYGSSASTMVPDLRNTDYLLCLGGNPRVSRWTVMSVPNDDLAILKAVLARGGKVQFVNPRRTESSTEATGSSILIKPGADVYFLAALLHEIERQGGFDEALLARHGKHVEELRAFARLYPPEKVADVTGIDSEQIRETARHILEARSAAVYMATGVNQSRQGVLCYWLVEMINFATGNLGRVGGTYKPAGFFEVFPAAAGTVKVETSVGTFELPDPVGYSALPAAALPALIRNRDIRALLVLGGNPLLTVGGETQWREAISSLDLIVSIDIYRQATCELSDYVLPSTDWLEHLDVNVISSGFQLVPYVQYTDAMEAPAAGRRNGWWILGRMAQAAGLPSPLDAAPDESDGNDFVASLLASRNLSIEQMRSMPSRTVLLEQKPHDSLFARCLQHPDKKIDCFPAAFVDGGLFERCQAIFEELGQEPPGQLKLISLRTPYMHNSWLANANRLRRGKHCDNGLHMSEADAAARGLHDGEQIRVFNSNGSLETRVVIGDDLRPGVVAMTHGNGHRMSYGLRTAQKKPGANCNVLMPVGSDEFEPFSYMSWVSGIPVEVERAQAGGA